MTGTILENDARLIQILTSFCMLHSAAEASPVVIDHEFGASHTYFHNRAPTGARVRSTSPPPEAIVQDTGVTTWMAKLSESSYAYHSRGRVSRPVVRNWATDAPKREFIPSAQWHTQTESSVSFHATGVRKAAAQEPSIASNKEMKNTIFTDRTESSICFHCRSAQ
jgi:hypothetical protein